MGQATFSTSANSISIVNPDSRWVSGSSVSPRSRSRRCASGLKLSSACRIASFATAGRRYRHAAWPAFGVDALHVRGDVVAADRSAALPMRRAAIEERALAAMLPRVHAEAAVAERAAQELGEQIRATVIASDGVRDRVIVVDTSRVFLAADGEADVSVKDLLDNYCGSLNLSPSTRTTRGSILRRES